MKNRIFLEDEFDFSFDLDNVYMSMKYLKQLEQFLTALRKYGLPNDYDTYKLELVLDSEGFSFVNDYGDMALLNVGNCYDEDEPKIDIWATCTDCGDEMFLIDFEGYNKKHRLCKTCLDGKLNNLISIRKEE